MKLLKDRQIRKQSKNDRSGVMDGAIDQEASDGSRSEG
jgi:hypothetical protein